MRLGLSSFAHPWSVPGPRNPAGGLGPLDLLARAVDLGVRVVQFGDNLPLDRLPDAELADLRAAADRAEIQIEVGMRGFGRDALLRYVRIAANLGSPILRLVTDTEERQPSRDEIVDTLSAVVPELHACGVVLAVENHDRFTSAQLREMIEAVGQPEVGVCLDTANSLVALEDTHTVVRTLAEYAVNLHLKDVRARRDPTGLAVVIEGAPAGQGQVDLPWVIERVQAAGRDPNAILEQWIPPAEDLPATLARESAWAEESVAYLRRLIPE